MTNTKIVAAVAIVIILLLCAVAFVVTQPATHTIEADAEDGGSISPDGKVSVKDGESVTFTATANDGYAFAGFVVNGLSVSSSTYTFENVKSDATITAKFVPITQYTVTSSATEGGTIAPAGESVVYSGSSLTFTATPSEGYVLAYFTVDDEVRQTSGNTFTLSNIHSNCAVTAVFIKSTEQVVITATASEGGTITPSGAVIVPLGGSQTFVASPDAGYMFVQFEVDGAVVESADNIYTFSDVTSTYTIKAVFERSPTHVITATATEGGTITPSGTVSVNDGDSVTFTFAANTGYHLERVLVDGEAVVFTGNSYTFTNVMSDHAISAVFASGSTPSVVSILVTTPSPFIVHIGEPVDTSQIKVTANYSDGSSAPVSGWTITPESWDTVGNKTAVIEYEGVSTTITVGVAYYTYGISATATEGGTILPGPVGVIKGESQSFIAVPNAGYLFSHFVVDGEIVEGSDVYTFENVTSTHTIEAVFVAGPPALEYIEITKMPTQTIYFEGDVFDSSGMTVMGHYSDGTIREVYAYSFSPIILKITDEIVTISYKGATAEVSVKVIAVVPVSIAVTTQPTKVSYFVGEKIDTSGMEVTVTYNNGATGVVTSGYTISPTSFNEAHSEGVDVTVSYYGCTATFNVYVYDVSDTSVIIKSIDGATPDKTEFNGYTFKFDSMKPGDKHTIVLEIKNDTNMNLNAMVFVRVMNYTGGILDYMTISCDSGTNPKTLPLSSILDATDGGADISGEISVVKDSPQTVTITLEFSQTAGKEFMNQSFSFVLGVGQYQQTTSP